MQLQLKKSPLQQGDIEFQNKSSGHAEKNKI